MAMTNGHLTARAGPWGVSYAANLTPNKRTGLGGWTADQFIRTMRTGKHLGVGRPVLRISARCLRGSNRSSQSKTRSRSRVRQSGGDDSGNPAASRIPWCRIRCRINTRLPRLNVPRRSQDQRRAAALRAARPIDERQGASRPTV